MAHAIMFIKNPLTATIRRRVLFFAAAAEVSNNAEYR
jgi:hypothetical protein